MKVDTSRLKKGTSEVPPECQNLIDKLKSCNRNELIEELAKIETWTFGKCELFHWIDILDIFDEILEEATHYDEHPIYITCDTPQFEKGRKLLLLVLNFTTLLIEHSFSRHLYNSVEHLTQLLLSTDLEIILGVLNLLYMFSKRSNFISRLSSHKKNTLLNRLRHIAEPYGGKECGFGLADCCRPDQKMPKAIYHFYYEYYTKTGALQVIDHQNISKHDPKSITVKLWKDLDQHLDDDQKYHLFARARLATGFWNYENRILFVQARLQALSILVYSDALMGYTPTLIYPGFLEELVELLELQQPNLVEIRAAALRTLTAIIHLERNSQYQRKSESRLNTIIEVTGASSYHGFLPTLVRNCIVNLTGSNNKSTTPTTPHSADQQKSDENLFPLQLATALFSFLYHLASYEPGAESLVSCGMMESLLRVINWSGSELEHITFVTRAVRVIDLITNLDMQSFQTNYGLNTFIKRLNMEVNLCRKEQSYEIKPNIENPAEHDKNITHIDEAMDTGSQYGDDDICMSGSISANLGMSTSTQSIDGGGGSNKSSDQQITNRTCLPQRAALLKSMLNFLKKAIQDIAFSDSIRHIMEATLPESLKHIISNSEYYGPSLFLLATDVVTVYVFQEPSLLSSLQDNGLTDVVLQALLKKDVPATREVLGSLPNVFSALCLNTRGMESFLKYNPFDKLFRVFISPVYLSAMRRRRSSDPLGDTASNIGTAMDELMRNQPSLKTPAIKAIIKLLEEIVELGTDPKYVCWRAQNKNDVSPQMPNSRQTSNNHNNGGSSDEDEDDEEEVSTSSHNQAQGQATAAGSEEGTNSNQAQPQQGTSQSTFTSQASSPTERIPTALIDYILNTMKFLEAILSNNSTDDHCREFVNLGGLKSLLSILSLPNLPVTSLNSPITATAQAVASVCKSILNLTHEPQVLQVALEQLSVVVENLQSLMNNQEHTSSSVLLKELANCQDINHAFTNANYTPLLHAMSAVHGYVLMLVHVCRSGQSDIRTLSLIKWGQDNETGIKLLKKLVMLYTGLVWESTLLLALCTDDIVPAGSEFSKDEMEKLGASDVKNVIEVNWDEIVTNLAVMENLTPIPSNSTSNNMDVDGSSSTGALRKIKQPESNVKFVTSQSQLKYIKSLLGASSRLGRALAELFGLLVRLCVGSPLRQRRGQNFIPASSYTSPTAREIARILSFILVDGLSFQKLPTSPVPKLKLTFLICSIGFTSPMLFDEKRFAYHLMLHKFIEEGGLEAYFEMFRWTLTAGYTIPIHRAIEHPNLPDGTGEALDAWLMLLEKMTNLRYIIESPHQITSKNRTGKPDFDTKHYLTYIHRNAFLAIQHIWGFKPLKTYGLRMTESMLSILKHIIKGEKVLQSKYYKNGQGVSISLDNKSKSILPGTETTSTTAATEVNQEHLRQLTDMGFSHDQCVFALNRYLSLEGATEYLLTNPRTRSILFDGGASDDERAVVANTSNPVAINMDIDVGEEDEHVIRAILNSLGNDRPTTSAGNSMEISPGTSKNTSEPSKDDKTKAGESSKNRQKEIMKKYLIEQPLPKKTIDDFTSNLLKTCLNILDQLPETVYKICDLLITVTKRNGPIWRDEMLDTLCKEIFNCIQFLIGILVDDGTKNYKEKSEKLVSGDMANKTAVRIHLFTLFFQGQYQDMKVPCANALTSYSIIPRLIKVLTDYQMIVTMMNKALPTPKWLAPLALLLDLYDKVALSTKQKQQMHKICTQQWQWYDISSSKWTNYLPPQNKLINDAYMAGESELQLMVGRHRYTINFKLMSQINDESSNHRPIIMALRSIENMNNPTNAFDEKAEDAEQQQQQQQTSRRDTIVASSSTTTTISDNLSMTSVLAVHPTTSEVAGESVNLMDVDTPAKNYVKMLEEIELEPLSTFVPEEIVSSCVQLMAHQQLDRDTLHAIMRVLVRLTKNYNMAEVFARFGGIDVLLNMKQNSGFIGFTTLATLLIRHVIEEPKTLSLAIQNVLVNRTLVTIPPGHRELVFLIRQLNSAVYRDPELFKEAALKILRVDFDSMKRSQIPDEKRFIMRSLPLSTNIKYNMEQSTAMSAVSKLLKALIEPDEPGSNMMWMQAEKSSKESQGAIRKEKFTAEPQPQQSSSSDDNKDKQGNMNDKPLLNKSAILKILAESVKSYQTVALHITEHVYRAGSSTLITEDTTALSFILDKMFHISDANMDRECPTMAQSLISAIASSDVTQAQETVVHEVKMALQRALNEPESTEKHLHIEGLATLIPAMIDSNNSGNTEGNQFFKTSGQSQVRHNIFYIMVEKGIITDIARAAQYLELGGPNTVATFNHLMKPLEMLLRLTNEPMPSLPSSSKFKKMPTQRRSQTAQSESDGNPVPPIVEQEISTQATEQQNNQTNSEALSNNVNATVTTVSAGTSNNPVNNQNRSTATNSDSTNAQDEQMLADDSEQNTDRDMSSAAIDSLVGENELGEVHLNEILDTLISEELRGINEYAEDANQDDNNDEEENDGDRRRMIRDNVEIMHVLGEESSSDSDDSESNASDNEEREMDEVEEIENDEDEEEENEERSELDDDEETQPFEMYDRHSMYGRHLSPSIPEIERDHEDILMIQYSNNAQNNANANNNTENRENRVVRDRDSQIGANINLSVTNNEQNANIVNEQPQNFLFNANFPLLYNENSEQGGNDNSNPAQGAQSTSTNDTTSATINTNAPPPNNHPLLSGRPDGTSTDRIDDRLHVGEGGLQTARRSNRTRTRYQFINVNTRNQPIILQRMLELRHNRQAGQNSGNDPFLFRDGTRVVVMDNGFSIFSNGDDLDLEMVDQSGYWFGRTLANHLNNHPSALSWWQEENKISGPDSNSDLCMVICDEMIPEIDAARSAELSKLRGKRKKKLLEEEEAKQRNQDGKKTNDEETAEIHVKPEVALSSVLTNVPVPIEPIRLAEPIPNNEFHENLSNQNDLIQQQQQQQSSLPAAQNNVTTSNNLNISFMDVNESEQNSSENNVIPQVIQPITISTQIVSPPQHITTDNQLNLDFDVEMASDNEESSASANNSRSFSPNYSPNSNQIETGEMNMLNRETPSSASNEQNQVSNMNIQDQNQSPSNQQMEHDHTMADSENGEPINSMSIEASQIPLPIDDSDDTDSGDDSDDDDDDKPAEQSTLNEQPDEEGAVSTEQLENAENVEEEEASGTTVMLQNIDPAIRAVLGDMEVPEGVDPSFLAALPPELRDEVVQEHIRQQRIRQRAQASVAIQEAQAMADVNPEFLAALPLNIQEEVLAQQRLEQQRQAAAAANPNDPVNAAEFFQNLQPSLRQAILTDMEDSQISALPPDLAAEAQTLRRDWETRNRQMQERILSSSFTTALRAPGNRIFVFSDPRVFVPRQHLLGFGTTGTHTMALTRNHPLTQTSLTSNMERQGAPLLDQESLASILVLLFIDDPNIGTLRLYRVIRNLCFHIPTRKWIIKSLLSIIMRCNEESMEHYLEPTTSKKSSRDDDKVKWLKLRLDSALGGRANVFLKKLEKANSSSGPLTIHPKASPTVCRHTLDLLIFLAKTFPVHFLPPAKKNTSNSSNSTNETSDSMPSTSAQALQRDRSTDFWDILLRLDNEIDDRSKKGAKIRSAVKQIKEFCEQDIKTFAESPFGQLITMLSYDIIRKNTMLTDKLLRLLSLISVLLTDDKYKNNNLSKPPQQQSDGASSSNNADKPSNEIVKVQDNCNDTRDRLPESERHLALTVDVLTSKSCSEDGLEDATSLLINLSQCSSMTKYMIIKLLVKGVIDLSHMVQKHINNLMVELRELNETIKNEKLKPDSNNDDSDELSKPSTSKGTLKDRFTKDAVIITAPSKVKTSNDLQLPSMAPLLSKTSNQSFFLRILKVITQIRDTVRQDSKVCDADVEQQLVKLETVPLSELLDLDSLWNTLSDCLKELEETQDHHAVLVLQPTVEAFFIVHSAPQVKTSITERNLTSRTIRNAGTAGNQEAAQRDNATAENANNNQANEERSNPENNAEQSQQVHLNIPIDETAAAAAAASAESNSEAGTSHERLSPMDTTQSSDGSIHASSSSTGGLQSQVSQQNLTADQKKFLHFAETHRVVLNQILRQSSVHLADGPFAVLVDHTRVLDFDVKRRYFRIELERLDDGVRREEVAVHVHRANVFEDSFRELYRRSPEEWKNRFYIVFEDEEGQDAGGLLREWYMIISREIFNPMYALFTVSPGDRVTYMINPSSHCNPNHLCYFKFVGRVIAKAIYDNKLLECYFTRAFYKHILGIQVKYTDMESEDYAFYQGLVYLMENRVESLGYDLTFSLEIQEFGVTEVRELKPNGCNITVTEDNKLEYIQLVCQLKMSGSIKQQLNAFLEGFYDIIPKRLISIFNEQELELLISGLPNIDIEDLRANTEYHKYQATSIQIQWFWRALRSFDQAERAKFLQFVTGTSKVPLQGFGALEGMNGIQKFQIHRDDRSTDRLPSAHTCFNQLDLPVYKSYDKLRTNLLKAIHECSEGFGFA